MMIIIFKCKKLMKITNLPIEQHSISIPMTVNFSDPSVRNKASTLPPTFVITPFRFVFVF